MINDHDVCVVMPAFNAAATLERTFDEIPFGIVDRVIVVDDGSDDGTENQGDMPRALQHHDVVVEGEDQDDDGYDRQP